MSTRDQLNRWGRAGLVVATFAGSFVALAGVGASPATASSVLFTFKPTSVSFGNIPGGATSKTRYVTITNISASPQLMSGTGGGVAAPFGSSQACEGSTLQPGQSCKMSYTFTPATKGRATGTSSGTWNNQAFSIPLTGTGVNSLVFSKTSIHFGDVKVSSTSVGLGVRITNESTLPVTMSGAGGGTVAPFASSQNCEDKVLAYGKSCRMLYTFTPAKTGVATGNSSGTWNFASFSITLSGTGT